LKHEAVIDNWNTLILNGAGNRGAKAPLASRVCRGCTHTEASILEWPVEAPTDDRRIEPYGAETPDDQAPGNKEEEPQEAPNEKHEQRSHVVPLSTSRIATMRAVKSTPAQESFSRSVITTPSERSMPASRPLLHGPPVANGQ
jgi:hypothetical protein